MSYYDALRKGRHSLHYQVYCITTVTRNRHPLFADINVARLLVHELRRLHEYGDVTSLAWVIMPDHLHWLIQLNECLPLSRVVKTLKARSALTINRHRCQSGSLWQRAYYDRAARKDDDIRRIARYIVANLDGRLSCNVTGRMNSTLLIGRVEYVRSNSFDRTSLPSARHAFCLK
jgi:REP element-mobilizing transposase RayT